MKVPVPPPPQAPKEPKKRPKKLEPQTVSSSYSLREEQQAMPGLPTQVPQQTTDLQRLVAQMRLAPELTVQRVVKKYRGAPPPEGQVGFGFAPTPANNLTLFDLMKK